MEIQHPASAPLFDDAMTELLRGSGIRKSSVIRVMGADGLPPLLWFCRHGYQHVGYMRPGPHPAECCDLLIVRHGGDIASLTELLDHGPSVRDNGVLVVQMQEWVSSAQSESILGGLGRRGYRIERCLRGHRRELHILCRNAAIMVKSAGMPRVAHPSIHN